MGTAVTAARLGNHKKALVNVCITIFGGACFLGCQALEWSHMIHEGARLATNPWGAPQFGAAFFVLTGFHGTHVLSGLVILIITAIRTAMGRTPAQGVELAGLYWHFVDLVWVFIFTLFYLLPS
jgi:cytochrome c oxidase subunit III